MGYTNDVTGSNKQEKNIENVLSNNIQDNISENNKKTILSDKKKKNIIFLIKILSVCLFAVVYSFLYQWKLYIVEDKTSIARIMICTVIFIIPSILLFIKIKIGKWLNFIISVVFSGFLVIENYVMLQFSQGYEFILEKRYIFCNLLVVFMIFIVVFAITNSFKASIITMNIVNIVMALANYYLVQFRNTGFLAVDILNIKTAANVAGGYTYETTYEVFLLVISSIGICFLATKLGKNTVIKKYFRIAPIALAIITFAIVVNLSCSDNYAKVLKVKYFRPQETFTQKGMYITFARSINDLFVEEPDGYSAEKVKQLAKQYSGSKATISDDKKPNIIMIMDEAFTDFMSFSDIPISEDNVPFFHSLKKNTLSGQLFVSVFGGGTASTEFEALTSNSMAYIPNGITAYTTYINSPMSSLATTLEAQGYGGMLAMHPFIGNGYKRDKVYPLLGFDRFITRDDFSDDTEIFARHISDNANMDKIISEYENYRKNNDKPFFMFNVTMQNHSPFAAAGVSEDIKVDYDIEAPEMAQYINIVKKSDEALEKLVKYFESLDEPTMIVFFGDHQPKLENEFYNEVAKDYTLDEVYSNLSKRNTQFVIWTNYDIESNNNMYISANRLSSLVLETAGLAQNGYQQFVSEFSKKVPIITKKGYIAEDGNFYTTKDKKSPYYEWINNYDIIEYNNIFDTNNRVEELYNIK